MDAVIIAGGIPQPQDPLYAYSKGDAKALIDIAGKPMVQWVLDALGEAKTIDRSRTDWPDRKSGLARAASPSTTSPTRARCWRTSRPAPTKVMELNPKAEYVLFRDLGHPSDHGADGGLGRQHQPADQARHLLQRDPSPGDGGALPHIADGRSSGSRTWRPAAAT